MFRMTVVTNVGNYVVCVPQPEENATNEELLKLFYDVQSDVEGLSFVEGWTPSDNLSGPPGLFALGANTEIYAFHVDKYVDNCVPCGQVKKDTILPLTLHFSYLGNDFIAKCVQCPVGNITAIYCYELNGEPPTDVLSVEKLGVELTAAIEAELDYSKEEYLLQVNDDGRPKNFSQAVDLLEELKAQFADMKSQKKGQAWAGWKGES